MNKFSLELHELKFFTLVLSLIIVFKGPRIIKNVSHGKQDTDSQWGLFICLMVSALVNWIVDVFSGDPWVTGPSETQLIYRISVYNLN